MAPGGGITIVSTIQINQMDAFKVQRQRQHELQLKWTAYHNCFEKKKRQIQLG